MNVTQSGSRIALTLSERNLRHLLLAFTRGLPYGLVRRCENGLIMTVDIEADESHYRGRPAGPGLERGLSHVLSPNAGQEEYERLRAELNSDRPDVGPDVPGGGAT